MNKFINNTKLVLLGMIFLFAFSCSKDKENISAQEQTVSSTEVRAIIDIDSQSNTVDKIVTDLFENGASGKTAKFEDCYQTEFSDTGYTVTFDACSVEGSEAINGSLSVTYKIGEEESSFTATYINLSVGDVQINGTKEFTMGENGLSFAIVSDMQIKLADGSVVEEAGTKSFTFVIDAENFANSGFGIEGDWTVKSDGNVYVVNITSPLTAPGLNCDYITAGVMRLNKNGLGVTIDFGDGTCDDIATLIYPDGTEEDLSLSDD